MVNTILTEAAVLREFALEESIALDTNSSKELLTVSFSRVYELTQNLGNAASVRIAKRLAELVVLYPFEIRKAVAEKYHGKPFSEIATDVEKDLLENRIEQMKRSASAMGLDLKGGVIDLRDPESFATNIYNMLSDCEWHNAEDALMHLAEFMMHKHKGDQTEAVSDYEMYLDTVVTYIKATDPRHPENNAACPIIDRLYAVQVKMAAEQEDDHDEYCVHKTTGRREAPVSSASGAGNGNSANGERAGSEAGGAEATE